MKKRFVYEISKKLSGTLALALLAGCSAAEAVPEGESETSAEALRCGDPLNDDPNCPWRNWTRLLPANQVDITHTSAPALCAAPSAGWLAISVDSDSRYRTLQFHGVGGVNRGPSWGAYGTRTFTSKPACAIRESVSPGSNGCPSSGGACPGFVVAGKSDGLIYANLGTMALNAAPNPQPNPHHVGSFSAVSNTAYTNADAGLPALASRADYAIALALMGDDNRVYVHHRPLPYTGLGHYWSARVTGPQLPANWTARGAPAIVTLPWTFQIVVHAQNNGSHRLYSTHFYMTGKKAGHFSNEIGSPSQTWTQLAVTGDISDGPALTYSNSDVGVSLYFRRGTEFMQTSGMPLGSYPLLPVRPAEGRQFASSPAATGGIYYDQGLHVVIGRTTSNEIQLVDARADVMVP